MTDIQPTLPHSELRAFADELGVMAESGAIDDLIGNVSTTRTVVSKYDLSPRLSELLVQGCLVLVPAGRDGRRDLDVTALRELLLATQDASDQEVEAVAQAWQPAEQSSERPRLTRPRPRPRILIGVAIGVGAILLALLALISRTGETEAAAGSKNFPTELPVRTGPTTTIATTTTSTVTTTSTTETEPELVQEQVDVPASPVDGRCVIDVASDDVLNVRSGPGVGNSIVATAAPGSCAVIPAPQTLPVLVGESTWVKVTVGASEGWVNARFLDYEPPLSVSRPKRMSEDKASPPPPEERPELVPQDEASPPPVEEPDSCLASFDPVCGAMRYDPPAEFNQPIQMSLEAPSRVQAGEVFEVYAAAVDPDAPLGGIDFDLDGGVLVTGHQPFGPAVLLCSGSPCQPITRYGLWEPPPRTPDSVDRTVLVRFDKPGRYTITGSVESGHGSYPSGGPYASSGTEFHFIEVVSS